MNILITGASGYIGKRLIPKLLEEGHKVYALARYKGFQIPYDSQNISYIHGDLLDPGSYTFPEDIDAAYYLVHSMSDRDGNFLELEKRCASNFITSLEQTKAKQVIYLTGLLNSENLSEHLTSRHLVETIIRHSKIPHTVLRAGIIVGAGSASFELIRDLVEKLPFMITPKWVRTKTQPISIYDTLQYLVGVLNHPECSRQTFDIGGPDVLSFKEMMLIYAKERKLFRYIQTTPLLTPKLSSYWLYFISKVPLSLASALINSLYIETVCHDFKIRKIIPLKLKSYRESIRVAFQRVEQNLVTSSWIDSWDTGRIDQKAMQYAEAPTLGCLSLKKKQPLSCSYETCIERIWQIGGDKGWYFLTFIWVLRGWIDRMIGGIGIRRGRRSPTELDAGNALDFWRVMLADKANGHLLLYAEMKMPGEAWLEFRVSQASKSLELTASFRPKGVLGRLYWRFLCPIHILIFKGLCKRLTAP